METVAFITIQTGDDLILSFAVQALDDWEEIESLIFMRTPKYEFLLEEHERRVSAHFERYGDDEDDYLEAFEYLRADEIIRIKTRLHDYELDVRKVEAKDLRSMARILHKLNFDQKVKLSGV